MFTSVYRYTYVHIPIKPTTIILEHCAHSARAQRKRCPQQCQLVQMRQIAPANFEPRFITPIQVSKSPRKESQVRVFKSLQILWCYSYFINVRLLYFPMFPMYWVQSTCGHRFTVAYSKKQQSILKLKSVCVTGFFFRCSRIKIWTDAVAK